MPNEIIQAIKQICEEKNISYESVIETIEAALAVAYRKDFGEKNQNIKVKFNPETTESEVYDEKTVVSDEKAEQTEKLKQELMEMKEKGEEISEEKKAEIEKIERFNPKTEMTLTEAKKIKKKAKIGDVIKIELKPPTGYGRMAAQTAKQVIIQKLREAERDTIYKEYKDKEGEIINGNIQRIEGKMVLIDLGHTTALLPPLEQIPRENYRPGQRLKFIIVSVNTTPKGPEIILSRAHPEMVKKLFYVEVPEINSGSVEIKALAREAGSRTKVAVATNQKNIDPVGSCVGQRGSRVQTIISELGGEKIDIIEWDEDTVKFIINALSPAKVLSVKLDKENQTALAEVKEDQLSLAIGKAGQNVRLSAKLTGWRIDIVSEKGEKASADKDKSEKPKEEKLEKDKKQETTKSAENIETTEEKKEKTKENQKQETTENSELPESTKKKEDKLDKKNNITDKTKKDEKQATTETHGTNVAK